MEVTGKVKVNGEIQYFLNGKIAVNDEEKSKASFKKRELVITTDEQYPQIIMIEFIQDKCDLLNAVAVGENVKVSINLGGREWVNPQGETKYFNSIKGWRIEKLQSEAPSAAMAPMPPAEAFAPATDFKEEEHDDLPF